MMGGKHSLLAWHISDTLESMAGQLERAGGSAATASLIRDASQAALAELDGGDREKRQAEIGALAATLEPPEVIRYAERLVRLRYPVLHPLYGIWGQIADELNEISHMPELNPDTVRQADWRRFNRAQALAWAIIDTCHGRAGQDQEART